MTSTEACFYTRCVSVNGFICLTHEDQLLICNPSTRQVIKLPEIGDTKWKSSYKYLGYDPVGDQYKVLLCTRCSNPGDGQKYMVLTLGSDEKVSWRRIKRSTHNYYPKTKEICIDGFVYYGAWTSSVYRDSVILCFDVRSERISIIGAPWPSFFHNLNHISTLINYKGKLAILDLNNITGNEFLLYKDVEGRRWSKQKCLLTEHHVLSDYFGIVPLFVQGTNKTGEIVISPKFLPRDRDFYIFYFNVETGKIRKVCIERIGDDEDFRSSHGIGEYGECRIYISPDYGGNIAFL